MATLPKHVRGVPEGRRRKIHGTIYFIHDHGIIPLADGSVQFYHRFYAFQFQTEPLSADRDPISPS